MDKILRKIRKSKNGLMSKPKGHSISHDSLRRKMSEVISLRERVKQAELVAGVPVSPHRSRASLRRPQ